MCDLQYSCVHNWIVRGQSGNKVLLSVSTCHPGHLVEKAYIDQGIPSLPKIAVGDQADCFSKLRLYSMRHRHHEPNQLTLDRGDLILWKLVIAGFIRPTPLDEVLEEESTGKTCIVRKGIGSCDLEE